VAGLYNDVLKAALHELFTSSGEMKSIMPASRIDKKHNPLVLVLEGKQAQQSLFLNLQAMGIGFGRICPNLGLT
jgi:hypothetical protein